MGIDLCLDQLEFHTVQTGLLLPVQFHLIIQPGYHFLQAGSQGLQAVVFGFHGRAGRKISLPNFDNALIQEINRF